MLHQNVTFLGDFVGEFIKHLTQDSGKYFRYAYQCNNNPAKLLGISLDIKGI